jgi:multiple sugar transport system permease protein
VIGIKGNVSSFTKRFFSSRFREKTALWTLVLPALIIICVAQLYPLLSSLVVSFRDWSLVKSQTPQGFTFENYIQAFKEPAFTQAIMLSAIFMVAATILELILGFIVAYCVTGSNRLVKISRTILIIPMAVAPVVSGLMWRMFLDGKNGLLNGILAIVGIQGPNWLGDPSWAMVGAILVDIWQWTPFVMVIFVAALSSISGEVLEAARVDGATFMQTIRRIVLPLVLPSTILILIFRIIDSFFVFDQIYTLTYGGPGTSTMVTSLYIYNQGLKYYNISYAAACSWILMIVSIVIAFVMLKVKSKVEKSYY